MQEALKLDPWHYNSLRALTQFVLRHGEHDGVDAESAARHRHAFYEVAKPFDKLGAAVTIHEAAVAVGDHDAATAIARRVRQDLGLDALNYGPARRAGSLGRVCSVAVFDLDLEDLCLSAIKALAGEAATAVAPIPDDVLRHLEYAFERLKYRAWQTGPKTGAAQRLKALLEAHPAPLWTSEHHRVHAMTAAVWGDRIASLRRAIDLDYGNLRARCDLAEALVATRGRIEAATLYLDLTSDSPPCNPGEALRRLEEQAQRGTGKPLASPEDPVEMIFLH